MKKSNKELEQRLNEAEKFRRDGKYQKSIKIILKLLKEDPDNYFLLNNLAITYQLNNQFFLAENFFKQIDQWEILKNQNIIFMKY